MAFTEFEKLHIDTGLALAGMADRIAAEISAGTGVPADDSITLAKLYEVAEGTVLLGAAANNDAVELDIGNTNAGLIIGNGTTATVAALSGVVAMDNAGLTSFVADSVDLAALYEVAEGCVLLGAAANNDAVELDIGNTNAGIMIGNGTTAAVFAISGDIAMDNVGAVTLSLGAGAVTDTMLDEEVLMKASVALTATQVRNLNATPVEIVADPGANKAIVPIRAVVSLDYNATAFDAVAGGDDLTLKYTNGAGDVLFFMETTAMLDQANDEERYLYPASAAATPLCEQAPVGNTNLVAHMLNGEIAAADNDANGDSPVTITVYYQVIDVL